MARIEELLSRWREAGVLDAATADRIREYELSRPPSGKLRWPVRVALAFGGIMVGAGVLLFVASHWESLSPASRFSLVLLMVAVFHVGGALVEDRFGGMAMTLHGLGTAALGAGIFLSGQIFHLAEHWPTGLLLWAVGAWAGWLLRGDWVQLGFVALLTPAWVAGEWTERTMQAGEMEEGAVYMLVFGLALLAVTYFTATMPARESLPRMLLTVVGGVSIIPTVILAGVIPSKRLVEEPAATVIIGALLFLVLPLALAWWLRGREAWKNGVAAVWLVVIAAVRMGESTVAVEGLCALGAIGMVAWGVIESRRERINIGVAGFAISVAFFYFSSVMDMLGRSLSLIVLGILFLAGGWFLEKSRRKLIAGVAGGAG